MSIVRQFTERFTHVKAGQRAEQKSAPQHALLPLDPSLLRQVGGGLRPGAPKTTW